MSAHLTYSTSISIQLCGESTFFSVSMLLSALHNSTGNHSSNRLRKFSIRHRITRQLQRWTITRWSALYAVTSPATSSLRQWRHCRQLPAFRQEIWKFPSEVATICFSSSIRLKCSRAPFASTFTSMSSWRTFVLCSRRVPAPQLWISKLSATFPSSTTRSAI